MKLHAIAVAMALASMASAAAAAQLPPLGPTISAVAGGSADAKAHQVWGFAASRIVGVYRVAGQVRPCGSQFPYTQIRTTLAFHAGGTLTEPVSPNGSLNAFGIPGMFTRTIGVGTWWYNPLTRTYSMSMRYDYFIDGVAWGTGTVDRDMQVSDRGDTFSGSVRSKIHAADGSVIVDLCGTGTNTRG